MELLVGYSKNQHAQNAQDGIQAAEICSGTQRSLRTGLSTSHWMYQPFTHFPPLLNEFIVGC